MAFYWKYGKMQEYTTWHRFSSAWSIDLRIGIRKVNKKFGKHSEFEKCSGKIKEISKRSKME